MEDNDTLCGWGENPVMSRFLVENFDRIRDIKDANQQLAESKIYTGVLLSSIFGSKSVDQVSQVIKIDITHPKTNLEDPIPEDPTLLKIREMLFNKFGNEVIRRINISLSRATDI